MWECVKQCWRWFFPPVPRDPYDAEWEQDKKWYDDLREKDGVNYAPIKEYADQKYVELTAIHDVIEKKAEWVFGIAFASAGALMAATQSWKLSVFYCTASFLFLFLAMAWALRIRTPVTQLIPMSIRTAVLTREGDPSWQVAMIASVHLAAEGVRRIAMWKSRQLKRAAWCLALSAAAFFSVMVFSHPFPTAETNSYQHAGKDSAERTAPASAAGEIHLRFGQEQ